MAKFIDDSGETIEESIIILAKDEHEGVSAEYEYLEKKYGKQPDNWNRGFQRLIDKDNKAYDVIEIIFPDGSKKEVFFNITDFYGK